MMRSLFWSACCLLLLPMMSPAAAWAADEWKPLFNGKDLTGWQPIGGAATSWHVEDDMLYCSGGGGGWLATDKEYANFELELEFRLPPGGNSGVFLRAPKEGDGAYAGMEIQVLDDPAKEYANIQPWQHCGSIYGVVAAKEGALKKAGEWQKYRIVCNGRKVKVTLNDMVIVDANLDDHKDKEASHPGLKRTTGFIGLQNHGTRLDYKNIRIHVLE
jgi:hypothetical protein